MATTEELVFDETLEPEVMTDKPKTKTLPCRKCHRPCVVTQFASPDKTECSTCRTSKTAQAEYEFNEDLETEVLTEKQPTKDVPCKECKRRCVVTLFKTATTTTCNTCSGKKKESHRQEVKQKQALTIGNPGALEDLRDGLINPVFRHPPLCPFDAEHSVELKSVCHSPAYGPRHFVKWDKGMPIYDQETGEAVTFQCNTCLTLISYSTMHPMELKAQNEARHIERNGPGVLESIQGVRDREMAA